MSLKRFNKAAAAYRESGKLDAKRAEMKAAEQNKNAYAGEAVGETVDSGKLTVESGQSKRYSFDSSKNGMANDALKPYDEKRIKFITERGDYIIDSFKKLKDVVNFAFDHPDRKAVAYFGMVNAATLQKIKKSIPNLPEDMDMLFTDNRDYSVATTLDAIRHMVNEKKLSRQDVIDYLNRFADTIVEYDEVDFHYYTRNGEKRPGLLFRKDFSDGKYFSFDLVSQGKRSLVLQSLYIDSVNYKKRKSAKPVLMQNAPASTPEAQGGQTSTTIISDSAKKSNSFEQNSQENAEKSADFGKNAASAENSSEKTESKGESSSEKTESMDESSSEKTTKERVAELKERINVKKIDAYCRENIEGYASMSAANQSMVRQVVREGRAYGLDDADILSYARVAARSGLNVTFDITSEKVRVNSEEVSDIAGYYDPDNNRIVVNPKAEKRQELILIHELDHAVRKFLKLDGGVHTLVYIGAEQRLSGETWKQIQNDYADQDVDVTREELLADEASAYYTEAILGPKITIDMLLGKEPSLAKKIINFFTGAARAYSKDAKLSKEARRHYKRFKKLFDSFAERNKGRNAETAGEAVDNGKLAVESGNARKSADSASQDLYSYASLVSKKEIEIKKLESISDNEIQKYKNDSILFGKDMRENAAKRNNTKNTDTRTYLYCKDLNKDILITRESFKHGAERMDAAYITISKNIDKVLETSIVINEVLSRENTNGGYVLLGVAEIGENYTFVRSVVNKKTWKLEEYEELSAIKKTSIKKEDVGFKPPHYIQKNGYETSSVISIHDLLENVKSINLVNEVFSEDVAKNLGVQRAKGSLSNSLRYSKDIEPTLAEDGVKSDNRGIKSVDKVADSRYNKTKETVARESTNGNKDTEILARGDISASDRSGDRLRTQSENPEEVYRWLGNSQANDGRYETTRAGLSGWLGSERGNKSYVLRLRKSVLRNLRGRQLSGFDTAGRELPAKIKKTYSKTVFKDDNGNLLSLYHWTDIEFDDFAKGDIGFHLGALGAARAYSKDAKLSKEARRHYKRFKKMFDAFAEWNKGRNAETAGESENLTRINRENTQVSGETVESEKSIRLSTNYEASLKRLDEGAFDVKSNTHIKVLEHTPKIFIDKAGATDREIIISWDAALLAMTSKDKSGDRYKGISRDYDEALDKGHYHNLGVDAMMSLPKALEDPLYIVKQNNGRVCSNRNFAQG